jgi:excisionase family DNA binding protein
MRSKVKPISENQITLSVDQTAEVLGVHKSTIQRLIAKGAFPVVRITPDRVGVMRSDIVAYCKKNRGKEVAA